MSSPEAQHPAQADPADQVVQARRPEAQTGEGESFEALLRQMDSTAPKSKKQGIKVGDRVKGTLVSIGEDMAFVDLGGKTEGRMELAALRNEAGELTAAVGDPVEAAVTGIDADTGTLLLGTQQGHKYHGLEEVRNAYSLGLPVQGQVTGAVKGGVEVQIAGLRGFCPASQIDLRFIEDLTEFVGQRLDFRVTKIEGGRRPNLVVSRRALLEEEQRQRALQTRAQLQEGAVLAGTVTSLKEYGAFVDIGGIEGMIHISELAFGHVKHPSEMLRVGQTVEVAVLRIEPAQAGSGKARDKIALSIRALAQDPWADADQRFPAGSRVQGTVSRLQPFGAFVELAPGIDGLVHVSALGAGRRINHPSEVLHLGDRIEATVLGVDLERRRISLTLEADQAPADIPDAAAYAPPRSDRTGQGPRPTDRTPQKPEEKTMGSFGALLQESLNKRR